MSNQPGEASINPQGLWRSEATDWSQGAGQLLADRKDSVPNRYHLSKGIDPFTHKWYISLLKDTTQVVADTDTTCQVLVCGAYIFKLNASGVGFSTTGASYTAVTGLSGTPVSMCTDGANVYIACGTGGIFLVTAPTAAATAILQVTSNVIYWVAFCSNVLLCADSNTAGLYQVNYQGSKITTFPTALATNAYSTWKWNSACGGNGWIYVGGFAGGTAGAATFSAVYKTQFESDGTTLTAPTVATPLPPGEAVYSLFAFVNYILVGTSLGMRFCQTLGDIDPSGQDTGLLKIGPIVPNLTQPVTKPVRCFTANLRFVYFGWSDYDVFSTGLGRIDISAFTGDQTPAYCSDLMVTGMGWPRGEITSMDWWNGAPIFVVAGVGVYTAATTYVPSGNIQSGYIGFRIPDQKSLVAYSVDVVEPFVGSIGASINVDDEILLDCGTQTSDPPIPFDLRSTLGELTETTLTLYAGSSNTKAPTVRRATLQAFPCITAGDYFIAAFRFFDEVVTRQGGKRFVDVSAELKYLEYLRQEQIITTYQEGANVWYVVVDDIDMVWYQHSQLPAGGFNGVCVCTMKSAFTGVIV